MSKEKTQVMDEQGNPMNADSMKEMTYHYKQTKKAWKKANRKAAWPLRILILVLILGIAGTGFMLWQKSQKESENIVEDLKVIPVTVTQVEQNDMLTTYKGNGDVVASSSVDVFPDTPSGKVTRIEVDLGDQVYKGQILLYIDPSRPGQTYEASPVKAPVSGTITSLNLELGSMVSMQMPIATIGDLTNLEVVTNIPEKYVSAVSLGQETRISLLSWDDEFVIGRINEISPVVNPTTRTMKVSMDIIGADERIKPGMFVRISMVTNVYEDVLTIPTEAMVERFDEQFVFLVDGDRSVKQIITSTLSINGISRVEDGLSLGDQIVLKGTNLLEDDTAIKVIEDK